MVEMEEVARIVPCEFAKRSELVMPVIAKVDEVAFASVVLPVTESVPVAVRLDPVILPFAKISPATESFANGEVVPMPTSPEEAMRILSEPPP